MGIIVYFCKSPSSKESELLLVDLSLDWSWNNRSIGNELDKQYFTTLNGIEMKARSLDLRYTYHLYQPPRIWPFLSKNNKILNKNNNKILSIEVKDQPVIVLLLNNDIIIKN